MNLSDTRLQMLFRCAYQYYRRYVMGDKIPPGIAAKVGISVDKTVSTDLTSKKDYGILLPDEQIQDIARDTLNEEWANGVRLTKEEQQEGEKKIKGECVDRSIRLAKLHHNKLAPSIEPVAIQDRWELNIEGYPIGLTGVIDIREPHAIRDTKTGAKKKTGAADKSMQLTIYALAAKKLYGKDHKLFLDFLVDTKTPYTDVQESTRTQRDFEVLFRRIEAAINFLEKGIFPPCNPETNYLCSPKYCGFYSSCPYV